MESKSDESLDSVLTRFFAELAPRLETARDLERELDRKLAQRFNVLDYLRDDELGLSRIIADLLNPKARHGQGTLFLQTLLSLEGLKTTQHWPGLDRNQISVVVERKIAANRRIDISVHIGGTDGQTYCLAIENKPYAGDQENQVKDYLDYLKREYCDRFLLIYLSPTGVGPSERSIHRKELAKWKDRFAIMPYRGGQEDQAEEFDAFRIPHSLSDWLGECRKNCEVDRLRWFLRDAETFCQQRLGDQAVITDRKKKATFDFVLSNSSNLKTALAVSESWPDVRNHVCKKFLNQIETAVKEHEKLKEFADSMKVGHMYAGEHGPSHIWLYRDCWTRYEVDPSDLNQHTSIRLQTGAKGPNGWYIGVSSPMSVDEMADGDTGRRQRLVRELKNKLGRGKEESWWPWWDWVDEDKGNWNSLVPDLHQECKDNDGEITRYFVDKFTEIAEKAIPVINGIKG